jgi:hypothetical protein
MSSIYRRIRLIHYIDWSTYLLLHFDCFFRFIGFTLISRFYLLDSVRLEFLKLDSFLHIDLFNFMKPGFRVELIWLLFASCSIEMRLFAFLIFCLSFLEFYFLLASDGARECRHFFYCCCFGTDFIFVEFLISCKIGSSFLLTFCPLCSTF